MAEEPPAEGAGHLPALDFQAGFGTFHIRIKIDNPWLAAGFLGAGILTLRAFYNSNRESVEMAVRIALAGLADRVLNITPSSILVELLCYTKETFLVFMDAFATGKVKQRLQEELSKIGFKDKLEVTITVYDIESEMRKEKEARTSDYETASDCSESSGVESMESEDMSSSQTPSTSPLKRRLSFGPPPAYPRNRELMTFKAVAPLVKVGTPTDDELEELAFAIGTSWEMLGRRLGVQDPVLRGIRQANEQSSERGYHVLKQWKQERGGAASYEVLNDALRHKFINRQDLAEKFCQV